jgi:hypothetical protein
MKMKISEAFAKYGASLKNVNWSVSAENESGELVLSLWQHYFQPEGSAIKYVDHVSRWSGHGNTELRTKIDKAFQVNQAVRCVIAKTNNEKAVDRGEDASQFKNTFHVKEDWFGKVTLWDGDNFVIKFVNTKSHN